jgi:hypothetical protein
MRPGGVNSEKGRVVIDVVDRVGLIVSSDGEFLKLVSHLLV